MCTSQRPTHGADSFDPDLDIESGTGPIENGFIVLESNRNEDGSPVCIGPYRTRSEAEVEIEDMVLNGIPRKDLSIETIWMPYASPGVIIAP